MPWINGAARSTERLILGGIFLLPIVCWAGLEHPFSTPKMWLLAVLSTAAAALLLIRRRTDAPRGNEWPWLIWVATLAISAITAPFVSAEALLLMLLPAPLCLAALSGLLPAKRLNQAILAGATLESAIVALQYFGLDPLRWLGWQPEAFANPRMRVYGTLGNPAFVAAWSCAALPLFVDAASARRPLSRSAPAWAALGLQLGAIFATGSRVFLLALPAAAAALLVRRMRISKWWLAGLPAAAALLWFSPARPLPATVEGRLYLARVAAGHWSDIPIFGYGPGSFRAQFAGWQVERLQSQGTDESARRFAADVDHAHNDYLEFLVEYGPAGACAFLGLLVWLIARAWRSPCPVAGAWAGMAALLAIAIVDFPFHRPAEWALLWLLAGMLGAGTISASKHKETS